MWTYNVYILHNRSKTYCMYHTGHMLYNTLYTACAYHSYSMSTWHIVYTLLYIEGKIEACSLLFTICCTQVASTTYSPCMDILLCCSCCVVCTQCIRPRFNLFPSTGWLHGGIHAVSSLRHCLCEVALLHPHTKPLKGPDLLHDQLMRHTYLS